MIIVTPHDRQSNSRTTPSSSNGNPRTGVLIAVVLVILLLLTGLMAAMLQQALRMTREANQQFEETQIEWLADAAAAVERSSGNRVAGENRSQELPAGAVFGLHAVRVSSTSRDDGTTMIKVESVDEGPLRIHAIREISTAITDDENTSKE